MISDMNKGTATWKKLGDKVSDVNFLPSEHVAIDVCEFPPGGWKNPHEVTCTLFDRAPDQSISRSEFEIPTLVNHNDNTATAAPLLKTSAPALLAFVPPSASEGEREGYNAQPGMSHHGPDTSEPKQVVERFRDTWERGRGGRLVRI